MDGLDDGEEERGGSRRREETKPNSSRPAFVSRRRLLRVASLGLATGVVGTPVAARSQARTLTIEGTGSRAEYVFSVSDDLEKSTANGGSVNPGDEITGSVASGAVAGGTDSYTFSGDLESFALDGRASVRLDGDPAHVGRRPDHVLTIEGTGPRAEYVFSVSDDLEKSTANGGSVNPGDHVSETTARGAVAGSADSYAFSGTLESFDLEGNAHVTLDGEPAHIGKRPDHVLSVEGTGSRAEYTISVSSGLAKSTANGGSVNPGDHVSGTTANGAVAGGTDSYVFSGDLVGLDVNGDATVSLDGEAVRRARSSPSLGVHSGLSDADFATIENIEGWQGEPYAVQNFFVPWNPSEGHLDWLFGRILPRIHDAGRVPVITWEPFVPDTGNESKANRAAADTHTASAAEMSAIVERGEYDAYRESLAASTPDDIEVRIADGEYDGYIEEWAGRLAEWFESADGNPTAYLRLGHEMNGDWYPWAPTVGKSPASSYVDMWHHVHDRFDAVGVEGVEWMWCVNAEDKGAYTAEELYPGDGYVDWLAIDGYQWGESENWSAWESPASIHGDMLGRVRGIADKRVCIAETASTTETRRGHDPAKKDAWIADAFAYFDEERIDLWCWFNEDKTTDWAMFDGARGTETVTTDGGTVEAYTAYRNGVASYRNG